MSDFTFEIDPKKAQMLSSMLYSDEAHKVTMEAAAAFGYDPTPLDTANFDDIGSHIECIWDAKDIYNLVLVLKEAKGSACKELFDYLKGSLTNEFIVKCFKGEDK